MPDGEATTSIKFACAGQTMSGPMDMDNLFVEFEPEIGFKKPLDRDFKITELTKFVTGKEFLGLARGMHHIGNNIASGQ